MVELSLTHIEHQCMGAQKPKREVVSVRTGAWFENGRGIAQVSGSLRQEFNEAMCKR